jgi:hypothetical protein
VKESITEWSILDPNSSQYSRFDSRYFYCPNLPNNTHGHWGASNNYLSLPGTGCH